MTTTTLKQGKLGKLQVYDLTPILLPHVQGRVKVKDMIVLHETVSPDLVGLVDIENVVNDLARRDYGIHGMTDAEGNIAWAVGCGDAVFWQTGGVNERSMGIEQVSRVMLESPKNPVRAQVWAARQKELTATARLIAAASGVWDVPLRYCDGTTAGVTTHWDVSQHFPASQGHTDCWPRHKGGYYPVLEVVRLAKIYSTLGWV